MFDCLALIGRTQPGASATSGMTCEKLTLDTAGIKFDTAPPDKPDAFSTYITAKAYRGEKE